MLNPYASYLGERDPLIVIQATAGELAKLATTPGRTPAPGKWDIRQILCHLADCEIAFAYRLRQAAAEDHHIIQPFNQDLWASAYGAYDASAALDVFRTLRQWNVTFIAAQPPAILEKKVTHPERGAMTFRTIVE